MNARQKLLVGSVASVVALSGSMFAHSAFAATDTTTDKGPFAGLASYLATKLNISESTVSSALSDYRAQEETTREQNFTDKLNQAVTDGKLTSAQKDLIVTKRAEIKTKMDALRDNTSLSQADRKTQMDAIQTELKTWASSNSIDLSWLRPAGGPHGHGGPRGGGPDGGTPPAETPAN